MKLAFVSDAVYPYNLGGKEKRLFDLTTGLARRGHQVTVYCMKWWDTPEWVRVEHGVTLHAICPKLPLYSGPRRSILQAVLFSISCLCLYLEKFDAVDVDHMPFFPLFTVRLITWLKARPMYATWHEVWGRAYWIAYMGWPGYISAYIEKISMCLPDKLIAVSRLTHDRLTEYPLDHSRIVQVDNGIDLETISKARATKDKSLHSDVIYAGRLLSHKNIDVLIDAISILASSPSHLLPRIRCLIIGEGPERSGLEARVKKLKLEKHIKFLNFFPSETDLYSVMKASRVFVLPSDREGFGLSVLEAQACGLQTVTIDHPDNNARFFTPHLAGLTPQSLAASLVPLLRRRFPPTVVSLTTAKMLSALTKVYES